MSNFDGIPPSVVRKAQRLTAASALRYGLDADDLNQEVLFCLWWKFSPKRATTGDIEDALHAMLPSVVKRKTYEMLRKETRFPQNATEGEMERGNSEFLNFDSPIDFQDQIEGRLEEWIQERRSEWPSQLRDLRAEGREAAAFGESRDVERIAQRAAVLHTLLEYSPAGTRIGILHNVCERRLCDIAASTNKKDDAVHKAHQRFREAIESRVRIESDTFYAALPAG